MFAPVTMQMLHHPVRFGLAFCLAMTVSAGMPVAASAQAPAAPAVPAQAQPIEGQPAPVQIPPVEQPAPRKPEGFFDALGRWMDKSAQDFKASVEESNAKWRQLGEKTEQAAKDAAAAQKEALDAFKNLSNVRVVEARRVCEPAPNGSPDCQAAAEAICREKGFAAGKSADIQTNRKCSARALLSRDEGGCRTETVVIKAACQ